MTCVGWVKRCCHDGKSPRILGVLGHYQHLYEREFLQLRDQLNYE